MSANVKKAAKTKKTQVLPGTVRIKASNLAVLEKTRSSWKRSSRIFPEAMLIIRLFKKHRRFSFLVDRKNPQFLKGQLGPNGMAQGARIPILPNGRKLSKAFSLFAPDLMIHDETSKRHWDVIYKNPGGTFSYLYTLDKVKKFRKKKYQVVRDFEERYPRILSRTLEALKDKDDFMALPMLTLLKTYMRVGNQIYYKLHRHKGLTTMKKDDIDISGRKVAFHYIGKGGVPTSIAAEFPKAYIDRLRALLRKKTKSEFVFTNHDNGRPLNEEHFKRAFKKYCGREFYPHIVRSFYATNRVKKFLAAGGPFTRESVHKLLYSLAEVLGHKRFVKKDGTWRENYTVTINHYVQPEVLKKIPIPIK